MDTVEIGMRIKKQRQLLNYTREELAEIVNITPRFCYDLELGNKKMSVDTLCSMKNALHVSADYLLYGESQTEGFDNIIAMLKECPAEKLKHLEIIISAYIAAINEKEILSDFTHK